MMDPITRRELLRRSAAGGAAFSLPALLAACGGGDDGIEGQNQETGGQAAEPQDTTLAKTLTISNWPLYIDVKGKRRPTLEQFERETNVRVRYIEDVNDNDEWFGKFQAQLSNGEPIGRDITVLTDWMAARMVRLNYVEPKNKDAIPNEANLVEALRSPGWDPEREFSLPWQSGLTGIAYNPKLAGGDVTTIEQLFTDQKLKGKVTALTEMPDTMGLVMLANGDDPTNVEAEAYDRAIETLQQAVDSGQIRRFTGNDYAPLLAKGEIVACIAWSGDIVQLQFDNPNLEFVIPDDGGMIWTDNMLIPQGGDVYTASTFMNFVYQPAIAAQIEAWVNYICPVQGAKEELAKDDPELAENELIFPSEETLAEVKIFDADAADNQEFKEKFATVTGA
jgi:spermidine/putrescine transport system substrate-binding protein